MQGLPPFIEHASIKIIGRLLDPKKLRGKRLVTTLDGSRSFTALASDPDRAPRSVGCIELRGTDGRAPIYSPHDHLPFVLACLNSGHFRYFYVHGKALRYGKAVLNSFSFSGDIDPADYGDDVTPLPPTSPPLPT